MGLVAIGACATFGAAQDSLVIIGRVVSDSGVPLPYAQVLLEGMYLQARTSDDGRYRIVVPLARVHGQLAVLAAQLIGYARRFDTIRVEAGTIVRDFHLPPRPLDFGCGPDRPRAPSRDRRPFTADELVGILRAIYVDCGPGPDFRDRVLDDSIALNYFAALLLGRAPWPSGADTLKALSWLMQAGDARFLPVYLRLTEVDLTAPRSARSVVVNNAMIALLQFDTLPVVQHRIVAMGKATVPAAYRSSLASGLTRQNTAIARALLREVMIADLPHRIRRPADSVLSRPLDPITVPATPPDSVPTWLADDSARFHSGRWANGFFSRHAIAVEFASGASVLDKQDAIDAVGGRVIGGYPGLALYIVQVPTDSTGTVLLAAVAKLKRLPQVGTAAPFMATGAGSTAIPRSP